MNPEWKAVAELAQEWCARFAQALTSLLGTAVACEAEEIRESPAPSDSLCWRQQFSGLEDGVLCVAASGTAWRLIAAKVLHAAGLETASDEESADTYCELLTQAAAGLAYSLTARAQREVLCAEASRSNSVEPAARWFSVEINGLGEPADPLFLSVGTGLVALWQTASLDTSSETPSPGSPSEFGTLELLLDVELPVSVSFGRSAMPIRDVLKLTTGSVVELDRAVTEPVELIVNNCVIARGEVVVVDGDYGVRISHIMSREDRIRSLR